MPGVHTNLSQLVTHLVNANREDLVMGNLTVHGIRTLLGRMYDYYRKAHFTMMEMTMMMMMMMVMMMIKLIMIETTIPFPN